MCFIGLGPEYSALVCRSYLACIGSLLIRTLPLAQAEYQIPAVAHLCIRTSNRITYAEGVSTTNRHQPNRRIEKC